MKISPLPSFQNSMAPEGAAPALRSVKMMTNATPGLQYAENPPPADEKLSIEDTSKTDAVIEDTKPISPQIAELAKRRRDLQRRERELQAREKALAERSQGGDAVPLSRLKAEPLSVLLESGVTYDQLTQAILANQANPEINALKAELATLKEGIDKKFTDAETQQINYALARKKQEAERLAADGNDFELVRELGHVPDVVELIKRTFYKTGREMDTREALKEIEDFLLQDLEKVTKLEKIRSKYMPEPMQSMQRSQGMRTLTNRDTASPLMDKKQRALAAFLGHPVKR